MIFRCRSITRTLVLFCVLIMSHHISNARTEAGINVTFSEWKQSCDKLEKPKSSWHFTDPSWYSQTALKPQIFFDMIEHFIKKNRDYIKESARWLDRRASSSSQKKSFNPFVQKVELPSDAVVALHGDLHGDVHALNAYIKSLQDKGYMDDKNGFIIKDPKFYMVFLGDYTDRGRYGLEVLYTILRLKSENPDRVFLVRGNHEDVDINARYGLSAEIIGKFMGKDVEKVMDQLKAVYNELPVALYLGTKDQAGHKHFMLCCHGGIEVGFDEKKLLKDTRSLLYQHVGALNRTAFLKQAPTDARSQLSHLENKKAGSYEPFDVGFMWYDFQVDSNAPTVYTYGRGWTIGKSLLDAYLDKRSVDGSYTLHGVFRAHQHSNRPSPMMQRILNFDRQGPKGEEGVGKLWNRKDHPQDPTILWHGMVSTFLVAPLTPYSEAGFDYDAFGLLKLAPSFADWKLHMYRNNVHNF